MIHKIVVMGVSGSGKSTLARKLAMALEGIFIEGDDCHPQANRAKMAQGIALCDSDREPWLDTLAHHMDEVRATTVVLSCSALKRSYRQRLRTKVDGLKFVFLDISLADAVERVSVRLNHEFPASLVADQFQTLEAPVGECRVLQLAASQDSERGVQAVLRWLDTADCAG